MTNFYNSASYKNKVINLLIRNENFVKLVNPTPNKCEELDIVDVLIGGKWIINGKEYREQGHVFDYNFVNDTIREEKTFVFVDTDIDSVRDNMFTDFNLYICIFTDKDLVRITDKTIPTAKEVKEMGCFASTYANRIDALCDVVDKILNGTNQLNGLGKVQPAVRGYATTYCPNSNYYGKCLKYKVTNYNDTGDECES